MSIPGVLLNHFNIIFLVSLCVFCGVWVLALLVKRSNSRRSPMLEALRSTVHSHLETAADGFVTLRGRLQAQRPCERFDDGCDAIVTRLAAGDDEPLIETQAHGIALIVGDAFVALEGRIELLSRFRRRQRALRYPADKSVLWRLLQVDPAALQLIGRVGHPVFCSLLPGDEVAITGRLTRKAATDGKAGYRQLAQRYVLQPGAGGGVLLATSAEKTPMQTAQKSCTEKPEGRGLTSP